MMAIMKMVTIRMINNDQYHHHCHYNGGGGDHCFCCRRQKKDELSIMLSFIQLYIGFSLS